MDLTIVGCSGSVSGPGSAASCYLVQAPHEGRRFSLVLDCGPGAFGALQRHVAPREVDAYALSHLHPDHCLDLCAACVEGRYPPGGPRPGPELYGPVGTPDRLARAYEVDEAGVAASSIRGFFAFRAWQPVQQVGPFTVTTARVRHPVEAYAVRVTDAAGATLVYSGDTGPCDALVDLARGADLLLVEAGAAEGPDQPPDLHLTGPQAARTGQQAGVGELLLTHIPPWLDVDAVVAAARPHADAPISAAVPGARRTVGRA